MKRLGRVTQFPETIWPGPSYAEMTATTLGSL